MGILVRALQKKDLNEVSDMIYALDMMFFPEEDHQRISREQLYLSAQSLNPNSPSEILVVEIGEQVVGYTKFLRPGTEYIPFDDAFYIGELYVKPDFRRQGAGTALIQTIIGRAKDDKDLRARRIIACAGNIEFYESIGFIPMKNPKKRITKEKIPLWSHEYQL